MSCLVLLQSGQDFLNIPEKSFTFYTVTSMPSNRELSFLYLFRQHKPKSHFCDFGLPTRGGRPLSARLNWEHHWPNKCRQTNWQSDS